MEDELAELRRKMDLLQSMVNASFGASFSILDIMAQALETSGAVDRIKLAESIGRNVAVADEQEREGSLPVDGFDTRQIGRGLLMQFVARLLKDAPPSPRPQLRSIDGGKAGAWPISASPKSRLTNGFSKKLTHHAAAVSLYVRHPLQSLPRPRSPADHASEGAGHCGSRLEHWAACGRRARCGPCFAD